ncbi:MAG: hypothetical protein KatS3mg118_3731 [Paracoccaceae bacterium]|nr:MAG: hypothetical protein KatS3mg118_3731 [Paracoccaceae bacterium]
MPISAMSEWVPLAAAAAEDSGFCGHWGFDFAAIRAAWSETHRLRGGSTISQQVAKNAFLWQGRSWLRKGLEAGFTLLVELLWPKRRIMEVYLNIIEMDEGAFGIAAGRPALFRQGTRAADPARGGADRKPSARPAALGRRPADRLPVAPGARGGTGGDHAEGRRPGRLLPVTPGAALTGAGASGRPGGMEAIAAFEREVRACRLCAGTLRGDGQRRTNAAAGRLRVSASARDPRSAARRPGARVHASGLGPSTTPRATGCGPGWGSTARRFYDAAGGSRSCRWPSAFRAMTRGARTCRRRRSAPATWRAQGRWRCCRSGRADAPGGGRMRRPGTSARRAGGTVAEAVRAWRRHAAGALGAAAAAPEHGATPPGCGATPGSRRRWCRGCAKRSPAASVEAAVWPARWCWLAGCAVGGPRPAPPGRRRRPPARRRMTLPGAERPLPAEHSAWPAAGAARAVVLGRARLSATTRRHDLRRRPARVLGRGADIDVWAYDQRGFGRNPDHRPLARGRRRSIADARGGGAASGPRPPSRPAARSWSGTRWGAGSRWRRRARRRLRPHAGLVALAAPAVWGGAGRCNPAPPPRRLAGGHARVMPERRWTRARGW